MTRSLLGRNEEIKQSIGAETEEEGDSRKHFGWGWGDNVT